MFKVIVTVVSLANLELAGEYRTPYSYPTIEVCQAALADDLFKASVEDFTVRVKGVDPNATISEPKCVADE